MRKISKNRIDLIDSIVAEGGHSKITSALLEKDEHLTDALHAIFDLETSLIGLVFCGGTSLSKAYNVIERMSEDADLKMVLKDTKVSKSQLVRQLSSLKGNVNQTMQAMGFVNVPENTRAFNENRSFVSEWQYENYYRGNLVLRPNLKIEFTLRTPVLGQEYMPIGYLAGRLSGRETKLKDVPTVRIAETAAEKVLSFLRRFAENRAGIGADWDDALVRHIYDVYCIRKLDRGEIDSASDAFKHLVAIDVNNFKRHQAFQDDPRAVLSSALDALNDDKQSKKEYEKKLLSLVYGDMKPTFEEAAQVFTDVAYKLIKTL